MVTANGKVKVLDFGLAAEIKSSMSRVSQVQGDTSGTRPYMAPEQWSGKDQKAQTDQYALAVMFYELIKGKVPFASVFDTNDTVLMMNLIENRMPEELEDLSKKQNKVLMRGLAKTTEERFASCADFIGAMGGGKPRKKQTIRKGNKGIFIFALIAILAIGGFFGYKKYEENEKAKAEQLRQEQLSVQLQEEIKTALNKATNALKSANYADLEKYAATNFAKVKLSVSSANSAINAENWSNAVSHYEKATNLLRQAVEVANGGTELARKQDEAEKSATYAITQANAHFANAKNTSNSYSQRISSATKALSLINETHQSHSSYLSHNLKQKTATLSSEITSYKGTLKPPGPQKGQSWTIPEVGMQFVWVSSLNCWSGKYEVTNSEYRKYKSSHNSKEYKNNSLNGENQPVVYVNFDDA